ncbi:MAG: hypothetical protein PVH48_07125 [Cyclobacteriaceae bacterium]|jgi:hypothetical protein
MPGKYFIFLIWIILLSGFKDQKSKIRYNGEYSEEVAIIPGKDSVFLNPVFLNISDNDLYVYESILRTPVCNDTLCQIVQIKVFWDLIGDYTRFDTLAGYPLTKNDHLLFTPEDYSTLQATLKDGNSILGRKSESELLDNNRNRYSQKIDAVTGATDLQIKNAVVDGALYSTYTLWHLVNGDIKNILSECTIKNYNSKMEQQLLYSDNTKSIIFALKQFDEEDYVNRFQEIIQVMKKGYPLVNFYIAKNLPSEVFRSDDNINSLNQIWQLLDPNTKSILADNMSFD